MMKKTPEQFLEDVAKKYGYDSWEDVHNMNDSNVSKIMEYETEAMLLYASELQQQVDPETAYVAGYKKRAEQSGLLYDFASELHARSYYIKFKSQQSGNKRHLNDDAIESFIRSEIERVEKGLKNPIYGEAMIAHYQEVKEYLDMLLATIETRKERSQWNQDK